MPEIIWTERQKKQYKSLNAQLFEEFVSLLVHHKGSGKLFLWRSTWFPVTWYSLVGVMSNSTLNNVVLSMFKSVQIHFHSTIHPPYMYLLPNILTYYPKQS